MPIARFQRRLVRRTTRVVAVESSPVGSSPPTAPLVQPLIAGLGGSRVRQSGVGSSGLAQQTTGGALSWMRALDPRQRFTAWSETGTEQNSFNLNGMLFANDGNGFDAMRARLPKLLSSDAGIVVMDLSSNSIQFTNAEVSVTLASDAGPMTVAGYCNVAKSIASAIQAAGKRVCILSVVERPTSVGGPWAAGQAPRLLIPAINAEMQGWAASQGMAYADIRSVLIDFADPDRNPLAFGVRDGTHFSTQGNYAAAKIINTAIAPFIAASGPVSFLTGANLLTNPSFTGTGGTVTGTGLTGQAPDGFTLSRETSASSLATVAASVVDISGTRWLRLLVNSSAMAADRCEGVRLTGTLAALTNNEWYAARAEVDVKAWAGWRTTGRISMSVGSGAGSSGLSGINPSGTPMSTPELALLPMPFPTEAYRVTVETFAAQATGTAGTFTVQVFFGQASGTGEILIALPAMASIADPNLLMRNEADVTPIAITSPSAFTEAEGNGSFARQLTTNKPFARWSLTGADAGLFAVDAFGLLTGPEFDFEAPADAGANNIYDLTITAADFNPANGSAVQPATITVTDINDGFFDNFNRPNEILDASPNWTKIGAGTGVLDIVSNVLNGIGSGSATSRAFYRAPQQGSTNEQQIAFNQRISSTNGPVVVIAGLDESNWIGVRPPTSGTMQLLRMDAGVQTVVGSNAAFYTPYVQGVRITAQHLGGVVRAYQSGVLIGEWTVSVPAGWNRSGVLIAQFPGGKSPFYDDFNNRLAVPIVSRIGLRAITVTPTSHVSGSDYLGTFAGRTSGSDVVVSAVTGPGGTWLADGANLRGTGLAVGVHNVTLTETLAGAINNGRASVVTVTVS
jgi:hypothetical protein